VDVRDDENLKKFGHLIKYTDTL